MIHAARRGSPLVAFYLTTAITQVEPRDLQVSVPAGRPGRRNQLTSSPDGVTFRS